MSPRSAQAFAETARAIGEALLARARRIPEADLVTVARDALFVLREVRADQDDAGARAAAAFSSVAAALRQSEHRAARQLLLDAASAVPADRLAAMTRPVLELVDDSGLVVPTSPAPPEPRALSRRLAAQVSRRMRLGLSCIATAEYARVVVTDTYPTRDAARAARERLSALVEPLLAEDLDEPTFGLLAELHGIAGRHLAEVALSLKPIVRVVTPKPLPACLLAWQLYQDTTRAGELVTLNGVATPAFMPTSFLALSPE